MRQAAIIVVAAALLLLAGCGSGHRVAHRKACAITTLNRKTHQTTVRRYACSDYHPVPASG
jgi:outer membrane murein-binding lipoprotein Lpp